MQQLKTKDALGSITNFSNYNNIFSKGILTKTSHQKKNVASYFYLYKYAQ